MTTDEIAAKLYTIYYEYERSGLDAWERESLLVRKAFERMAEWVQWQLQRVNAGKSVEERGSALRTNTTPSPAIPDW